MKKSEARIILYINTAAFQYCYGRKIAIQLKMDYPYTLMNLARLTEARTLKKFKSRKALLYTLINKKALNEASKIVRERH